MKKEKLLGEHFVDYIGKLPDWRGQTQNVLIFEEIFHMFSYAEQFSAFLFSNSAHIYNTGLLIQAGNICLCKGSGRYTVDTYIHRSQKCPKILMPQ